MGGCACKQVAVVGSSCTALVVRVWDCARGRRLIFLAQCVSVPFARFLARLYPLSLRRLAICLLLCTLSVLLFRCHLFTPSILRLRCHISTPSCHFDAISRLSLLVSNRPHAFSPIFHTVASYLVICFLYVASLSAMCASSLPTMVLSGTPTIKACQITSTTVAPTL